MSLFSWQNKKGTSGKKEPSVTAEKAKPESKPEESMKDLYGGGTAEKTKAKSAETRRAKGHGQAYRVLIKPLVTEKAAQAGANNHYVFAVAPKANKIEVAKAIDEIYGIKPVNVNMVRVMGKELRYGRKTGRRKDWKKAIVKLPAGKTINIYEGV